MVVDSVVCGDESKGKKGAKEAKETTLFIPGGTGTRLGVKDEAVLRHLAERSSEVERVCTVCTGSALLAHTGRLDGLEATTNKMAFDWVKSQRPHVRWKSRARWVRACDRNGKVFWTSSGVSAGMDMAYAIIAEDLGEEVAAEAARYAEYVPDTDPTDDPFAKEI